MLKTKFRVGILIIILGLAGKAGGEGRLPYYLCKQPVDKINIDGRLDELSWLSAKGVNLVLNDGTMPTHTTIAKMLWDEKFLYIAFHCEDPDIWATMKKRDDPICKEEAVEIFLDADNNQKTYIEIEISPRNVVFDLYMLRAKPWWGLSDWNSPGLSSKVKVEGTLDNRKDRDEYWDVEIALPFTDIITSPHSPPQEGDLWRINLYRIERPKTGKPEYSALSPVKGSFHQPAKFGKIIFIKEKVGGNPQ